jgi:hypothetical protein
MVISQSLPHRFLLCTLVVFGQESLVLQRLHPLLVSVGLLSLFGLGSDLLLLMLETLVESLELYHLLWPLI